MRSIIFIMKPPITMRLRDIRERSGLSMAELAKAAGYKGASSYQRYEDPALYTKDYLPLDLIEAIAPAMTGKGMPPITQDEVYALARAVPPDSKPR